MHVHIHPFAQYMGKTGMRHANASQIQKLAIHEKSFIENRVQYQQLGKYYFSPFLSPRCYLMPKIDLRIVIGYSIRQNTYAKQPLVNTVLVINLHLILFILTLL